MNNSLLNFCVSILSCAAAYSLCFVLLATGKLSLVEEALREADPLKWLAIIYGVTFVFCAVCMAIFYSLMWMIA